METNCPVCDEVINLENQENIVEGQKIVCSSCSSDLEVVEYDASEGTVVLEEAPEVEEDWGE